MQVQLTLRPTPEYVPGTSTASTTPKVVFVRATPPEAYTIRGQPVGDQMVSHVGVDGLSSAPKPGDKFKQVSITDEFRIVNVTPVMSGDAVALYTLVLER